MTIDLKEAFKLAERKAVGVLPLGNGMKIHVIITGAKSAFGHVKLNVVPESGEVTQEVFVNADSIEKIFPAMDT
jgi:2-hydroxy-3-keto-5-methylthiopentenyl-1-phosphate phosphatase